MKSFNTSLKVVNTQNKCVVSFINIRILKGPVSHFLLYKYIAVTVIKKQNKNFKILCKSATNGAINFKI